MNGLRYLLIIGGVVGGLIGAAPAAAERDICERLKEISDIDPKSRATYHLFGREDTCRRIYWTEFKAKPIDVLLNAEQRQTYERALELEDCETAELVLRGRFVAAHPEAPSIAEPGPDQASWRAITLANHYPRLELCSLLTHLADTLDRIAAAGLEVPTYIIGLGVTIDRWIKQRQEIHRYADVPSDLREAVMYVYNLSQHFERHPHPPAALALLKLAVERKIIGYSRFYELYLAYRLEKLGVQDPVIAQAIAGPAAKEIRSKARQAAHGDERFRSAEYVGGTKPE